MMKKLFFITTILLFQLMHLSADNVSFKAVVNSTTVVSGEQFAVQYVLSGEGKDLRAPEFTGFDVLSGPNVSMSVSRQIVNGQMSSETTKTFTFILLAGKEGTFKIAPATVKIGNRQYTSNGLVLKVLPPDKADAPQSESGGGISNDQLFMQMTLSKKSVYEQEPILVTFKLFSRTQQLSLNGATFPAFEGFVVQDIELPENKSFILENYNGLNYNVVTLKQALLFPQRTGKIEIEPGKFDVVIQVRQQSASRNFFDNFFDNNQQVNKTLTTNRATINVEPLPFGKPTSYMGGVGEFTIKSSISSNHVKANEAVTVKVEIKGNGNLKYIKNPEIAFPSDFETYDPKVDLSMKVTAGGVQGTKTIEYVTIPRFGGDFTIPGIEFSYFDPKTKSYKTLTTGSFDLKVDKGAEGDASSPVISNFSNKENVKLLGQDIHFIKLGKMNLQKEPTFIYGSLLYLLCFIIPALLFLIFVIINRKQAQANANIALTKTRKANKVASKRLKLAGKYLKAHEKEAFYDEVLKAVWGYLSDKLNLPLSILTKDNVETELSRFGAKEELITEFIKILSTCEFARYAPVQADNAMDQLYAETIEAIGKMENTVKK